jgi:predicted 3-demethylubiquinone-9 3-methyltransferase (glyoxalase superfamily)
MPKNVICLWYDGTAEDAARFYAEIFPDSAVTAVHHAPGDYPAGRQEQVLTVEFTPGRSPHAHCWTQRPILTVRPPSARSRR